MAVQGDGDKAQRQPRHYPLDIPDLPFHRYDHRRLAARDIMVHRLMADFTSPSRVHPAVFLNTRLQHGNSAHKSNRARAPRTESAREMLADLEVLERMLFTSASERLPFGDCRHYPDAKRARKAGKGRDGTYRDVLVQGPPGGPNTVGDRVLDAVLRYYFETDEAAMRVWVSHVALPRMPEGPLPTTRRERMRTSFENLIKFNRIGNAMEWQERHSSHLSLLRRKAAMQDQLALYDGGSCLAMLRQQMDAQARTVQGTKKGPNDRHWMTRRDSIPFYPVWPEFGPIMRFILQHSDVHKFGAYQRPSVTRLLGKWPLDLSQHPGRCRNRVDTWATGPNAPDTGRNRNTVGARALSREGDGAFFRRRRCTSEPRPRSFASAYLPLANSLCSCERLQCIYPRMTLSQLDRRARRRSLSRTHIEGMFDWKTKIDTVHDTAHPQREPHCENCLSEAHRTIFCCSPCGHCGAPSPNLHMTPFPLPFPLDARYRARSQPMLPGMHKNPHLAPQCPVARHNRCKCVPFPTFHAARKCGIPCRRACGNLARPGSFQHRNAMTCRARCCMCGLRGHSGQECRLQRCRCGGPHLGQDCGWKPTCRVQGCDRFLCGLHCRECGSTERPFVGWRCWRCLGFEKPLERDEKKSKRRRRKKGASEQEGEDGGEALPDAEPAPATTSAPTLDISAVVALPATRDLEPGPGPEREARTEHQSIFGDPRSRNASRVGK